MQSLNHLHKTGDGLQIKIHKDFQMLYIYFKQKIGTMKQSSKMVTMKQSSKIKP